MNATVPETVRKAFPELDEGNRLGTLAAFAEILRQWNQRINLISRNDEPFIWERHIVPSLAPLKVLLLPMDIWLMDIGSGGGFPGLVLKIARPDLQILLVESVKKKALFLKQVIQELGLPRIAVANHRAEELAHLSEFRKKFDVVTARAVARISQLVEWGEPFLGDRGYWFLWKSQQELQELQATAVDLNLSYQIFSPPEPLRQQFPRLANQLWFKIHRPLSSD